MEGGLHMVNRLMEGLRKISLLLLVDIAVQTGMLLFLMDMIILTLIFRLE
jgi:hypothetical protein